MIYKYVRLQLSWDVAHSIARVGETGFKGGVTGESGLIFLVKTMQRILSTAHGIFANPLERKLLKI